MANVTLREYAIRLGGSFQAYMTDDVGRLKYVSRHGDILIAIMDHLSRDSLEKLADHIWANRENEPITTVMLKEMGLLPIE